MSRLPEFIRGDAAKFKWISSGTSVDSISSAILNGSDTLVSSSSMTSSGDGHYYQFMTVPSSDGYYVGEMRASIGGNLFVRRKSFRVVAGEVD